MEWLNDLIEKRRQKTLSNKELYVALVRKGAVEGELSPDDRRKLANVADTLNISASQLQGDAQAIGEFAKCEAEMAGIPAAENELHLAADAIFRSNAEIERVQEKWRREAKDMESRLDSARRHLNGLASRAQRAKAIRDEFPHLFIEAETVAE